MAKPNYSFAKRQREIAKQQKKELKRQQKAEAKQQTEEEIPQEDSSQQDIPQPPVDENTSDQ